MTRDRVRRLMTAQPFEPSVMHLADGGTVRVHYPEFILLTPDGATCVVWEEAANAFGIVDLHLVTQLRVERNGKSSPKKSDRNKKRKRK